VNGEWFSAGIGFIGVIVGGALAGGVSYVLERRRERVALRVAARLIEEDLRTAYAAVSASVEAGCRWAWPADTKIVTSCWNDQRGLIAANVPHSDWRKVTRAVRRIHRLQDERGNDQQWQKASERQATRLRELQTILTEALDAVSKHA
jgi:hypothetical protein